MAKIGDLQDLQAVICRVRPERTFITTYCASLSYLESGLLDALRTHGRPRVCVLIDAVPHEDCRAEVGLRFPGVRYEPYAVTARGGYRFHPKTYALLGESHATVIVASANLTVPGFRGNWEVFEVLDVERASDGLLTGDAAAIAAYADFLDRLAAGAVTVARDGQRAASETAEDLRELLGPDGLTATAPADGPHFLHSLDEPILDQVELLIPANGVERITAYSPYYDGGAIAVRRLLDAFPAAKRVDVVLDPSSEAAFNGRALASHTKRLKVHRASSPESAAVRFLHAKLLAFETREGTWLVSGSANLTTAGLCGVAAPATGEPSGNVEAVVVRRLADRTAAKRLLSVVPRTPWEEWPSAVVTIEGDAGESGDETCTLFDAELDDGVVRCVLGARRWTAGGAPSRVTITIEDQGRRLVLEAQVTHTDADFVEIEAPCTDAALWTSDQPARVIVDAFFGRDATMRGRRGWGWLRRPQELARSASAVSMRERLRPLRQTATPSAETLIELHNGLATALARLGQREKLSGPTTTGGGTTRTQKPLRGGLRTSETIDIDDLLQDDAPTSRHGADAHERPHDYLRAISDTLRTHIAPPSQPDASGPAGGPSTEAGRGGARQRPGPQQGKSVTGEGASPGTPRRARPPAALSHAAASELARLAATFSTAVRRAPMTAEGLATLLDIAETIGLIVLAADVVRSPADDGPPGALGPRAALAEALSSWWASLLSIAPGPDGAPKGILVRAWADVATRVVLEDVLRASETTGARGLAGLTAGLAGAAVVLRHEGGHALVVDEALDGLALLAGHREPIGARSSAATARGRLEHATTWWPEPLRAAFDSVWAEGAPAAAPFLQLLRRWWALEDGRTLSGEEALSSSVLRRRAHVLQRYPDPIATLDPATRGTSCCPTLPTHTGFPGEVARAWPAFAVCPNCGRLVAPPEVHNPLMRAVVMWLDAEAERAAAAADVNASTDDGNSAALGEVSSATAAPRSASPAVIG